MTVPTPPTDYHYHQGEALALLHDCAPPTTDAERRRLANTHAALALAAAVHTWHEDWNHPVDIALAEPPAGPTWLTRSEVEVRVGESFRAAAGRRADLEVPPACPSCGHREIPGQDELLGIFELGEPWVCVRDRAHRPWIVVVNEDGDMIALSHDLDPDADVDVELPSRVEASVLTYPLTWLR